MNLQSKFGYFIINQTLHFVFKRDGITDRRTDDPITRCPRRTFQVGGIKNSVGGLHRETNLWQAKLRVPQQARRAVPGDY